MSQSISRYKNKNIKKLDIVLEAVGAKGSSCTHIVQEIQDEARTAESSSDVVC